MKGKKLQLPPRSVDGHKGTFGTVCVVGGRVDQQRVMVGGPALCALGALRSGCGLAVLAVPQPMVASALTIAPVATGLALPVDERGTLKSSAVAEVLDRHMNDFDCLAIGPGLGTGEAAQQVVARVAGNDRVPVVIDADGLNCLAAMRDFHRDLRAPAILTPHPGEFGRLARALGIKDNPVDQAKRQAAASELAQRLGCVVALKGHRTVVSDGQQTFVNETGNVALASGGTGDVLTGIIAGFIAQFFGGAGNEDLTLLECARLAVHVHGLAADHWARTHGKAGMLATDLLGEIPAAMKAMRGGR